jgi:hypothetical protein
MALDFPANPIQGQQNVLGNGVTYQWDGSKWSTRLVASYANTGGNPGVEPPPNPSPGTFWWDSENGQLYIWYVDANTSQWMQAAVLGTTYDSQGNVVTNSTLSARNLSTGVYDLSLGLEGQATYDGNQILDLPIQLELGQNLEVTSTNQVVTDTDTD